MFQKIIFFLMLMFLLSEVSIAKSCQQYRSCAEVIADYPNGNFGAKDRDKDGIPCENVCRSREQVEDLLKS